MRTPEHQAELLEAVYAERAPLLGRINRVAPWHVLHRHRTLGLLGPYLVQGASVLDLACGTGILASAYAPQVRRVTLVDLLPSMIQMARTSLAAEGKAGNVDFYAASIDHLPAEILAVKYELVLLTQAINFIEDTTPVFEVAARCLAPDGILHLDIDNPLRWVIIEALSGHIGNAQAIAGAGRDMARNIVGADYWFHPTQRLVEQAEANGLELMAEVGIGAVSSLVHIFNQSSDFLMPDRLDARARPFLDKDVMTALHNLDIALEAKIPAQAAGWSVLQFKRKER